MGKNTFIVSLQNGLGNVEICQDIRKGRATEIESINGEVIKRGRALGIDTPYNETVYNLVKAKVALHSSGTEND